MDRIPFFSLEHQHQKIKSDILESITQVLDKNWFVLGNELKQFEQEYADFIGTPYGVGVGNGLDAITLALLSCGISQGDEVIVPAHTFIATWLAVSRTGARITPIEPETNTFNIDVTKIEAAITPKTKVILPVHLYGHSCDMTAVDTISKKYNLIIIEDNAQAQGAKWLEKFTGSYGEVNATSFYPTKNLGALGDGGAITTYDKAKFEFAMHYRNYGLAQKHVSIETGVNSKLDEIQAAVLRKKLLYLNEWNQQRRDIASKYLATLQGVGDIALPLSSKEAHHVYHLFVIRTAYRDALKKYLADRNVETMIHYPIPPHLQKAYNHLGYGPGDFPITEQIAATILSLPLWPGMREEQVDYVCETVKRFFEFK